MLKGKEVFGSSFLFIKEWHFILFIRIYCSNFVGRLRKSLRYNNYKQSFPSSAFPFPLSWKQLDKIKLGPEDFAVVETSGLLRSADTQHSFHKC